MKGILNFIIAIMVISPCFSQGNITYAVKLNSVKKEKTDSVLVSDLMKRVYFEISTIESDLTFSENLAVFKNAQDIELDVVSPARKMANIICGTDDIYYYDLLHKRNFKFFEFEGEQFLVQLSPSFVWNLENESKKILNYICYKAKTKGIRQLRNNKQEEIEVVAWYAPDLPIPIGPKGYHGLPGLILQLEEGENRLKYEAKKVELNKKIKPIKIPEKIIPMTEKEFHALANKAFKELKE